MDCHVSGAMLDLLEAYRKLKTKPKTIAELKKALQVIWGNLPQGPTDIRQGCERLLKATEAFGAGSGHFGHSK